MYTRVFVCVRIFIDQLIKHGIMEAPEVKPTDDELALQYIEAQDEKAKQALYQKTLDELDELSEDDSFSDDDHILDQLRAKRIAEMKQTAKLNVFGNMKLIRKPEFVAEVTEASKKHPVVCHLFCESKEECHLLNRAMTACAKKFPRVKFLYINSRECIDNYPDKACPTLLIYKGGEMVTKKMGLREFGGSKTNATTLEYALGKMDILTSDVDEETIREMMKMKVTVNSSSTTG